MRLHKRFSFRATTISVVIASIGNSHSSVIADEFWQSLGGPEGGSVLALARDANTNAIYAGTSFQHGYNRIAGSIFKSTDDGAHWSYVSSDFFSLAIPFNTRVRALAVNDAGQVFAGLEGAGVFTSTDGGANWSTLNAGLGELRVRAIAVSPTGETYAGTESAGVYRLADGSWLADNVGLTSLAVRGLAFGAGYELVGTAPGGVFKRTTAGNWTAANAGLADLSVNSLYVSSDSARVLASTNTGLFESLDQAASWHPLVGPFTGSLVRCALEVGDGILVGTPSGLFVSDSTGMQWTASTIGYSGAGCQALLKDDVERLFVGSLSDGVFRSTDDAASWVTTNEGLFARTVTRLLISSTGTIIAGTNAQGIFRSDVLGAAWTGPHLEQRSIFALAESPWGDLFAGNYTITPAGAPDGHAWRSSDGGDHWTPLDNGLTAAMVSGFAFVEPQQVICSTAWGANSIRTSQVNGDAWSPLAPGPGNESYCLTRNAQGDLFTGSEGHGVKRFNAANQTWTILGLSNSQQFSIAINSLGHVFVGNDGNIKGVYKSVANGDALMPLNTFPGNYGYAILCSTNDDLYVGTRDSGIQYSNNGGATWTAVNSGIPVSACQSLALGPDGYLYAGVAGFGVFRSTMPIISKVAGDIDGDGDVEDDDLALFVGAVLGTEPMPIHVFRSDLNTDGQTDGGDIGYMATAYLGI